MSHAEIEDLDFGYTVVLLVYCHDALTSRSRRMLRRIVLYSLA